MNRSVRTMHYEFPFDFVAKCLLLFSPPFISKQKRFPVTTRHLLTLCEFTLSFGALFQAESVEEFLICRPPIGHQRRHARFPSRLHGILQSLQLPSQQVRQAHSQSNDIHWMCNNAQQLNEALISSTCGYNTGGCFSMMASIVVVTKIPVPVPLANYFMVVQTFHMNGNYFRIVQGKSNTAFEIVL